MVYNEKLDKGLVNIRNDIDKYTIVMVSGTNHVTTLT